MSATATPIPPERFAEAIANLPLANLHFKAAEIRNSISHLHSSNSQLRPFAGEGDRDCGDAIAENEATMRRMEERVLLLRREVERRGFLWGEDVDMRSTDVQARIDASKEGEMEVEESESGNLRPTNGRAAMERRQQQQQQTRSTGGTLGDAELTARLRERMDEDEEGGDGVHL